MLKTPKTVCGSSEEEGGAQHHAPHLTVATKNHGCLWEIDVFTRVMKESKVSGLMGLTVHSLLALEH